ncbi:MAG: hypothetical protein LUG26_08425 [Ruminococcus sp.]|nr:hypothetical protein [Ruminococcus sp.]
MFCKNCGSEISDDAAFYDKCGASTKSGEIEKNVTVIYDQNIQKEATRYASTALKFALIGLLCCVCCGFPLLLGIPAIYFGSLAIKNNESEIEKAKISIGIGVIDIIIFIIIIIVGAMSQ